MVYHPYPLSEVGWTASEALEAAGEQGKFWEFHDQLLYVVLSEDTDIPAVLNTAAMKVGLDISRFQSSMSSGEVKSRLEKARQRAVSRGVNQAGIYLNGKAFLYVPGNDLRSAIDTELQRLGKQ